MHEYGYSWDEMLPLTKDRATELFGEDVAVYRLHADGSKRLWRTGRHCRSMTGCSAWKKGLERL